jgi:hypothetical protein
MGSKKLRSLYRKGAKSLAANGRCLTFASSL